MNWQKDRKILVVIIVVIIILVGLDAFMINNMALYNSPVANEQNSDIVTFAKVSEENIDRYLEGLHSAIKSKYGEKLNGYDIAKGELLEDGSWYITTISKPLKNQWSLQGDIYRIVLHKIDGEWEVVAEPSLVFAYRDYPNIPKEILASANNL